MKFTSAIVAIAVAQSVSAHYIWHQLVTPEGTSSTAIRQPPTNSPVEDPTSADIVCNASPAPASDTLTVAAGSEFTFKLDNVLYHPGPAAIYLGQVPTGESAASWDGSGANWFKVAEWGANFDPFAFVTENLSELSATIPASVAAGEYLLRIEQIGLHVAGAPQWYISCAQINVTGGGSANPAKVSIPGYVSAADSGLAVNIYYPIPTSYDVPGPAVFTG